jgi:cytochrome d ubiquinol oxidase subunit I
VTFDALHLARAQFAFTMSFHFIFPAFSIGLASYLAVLEGLWLRTSNTLYLDLFKYWVKIFAVVFGMGVVSGIVMSYQFGTNWSAYSNRAGPIIGPLMAYEVLTAFFLEAGFLGVMLFGMTKVGKGLHFFATCMVAFGTLVSATWIISVNSWMQTPAGFTVAANGQFVPAGSWWPIIFSASFPYRLVHTVIAAYLTTALTVGGVGAWHLLKDKADPLCAQDVLDGHVDGGARGAGADSGRRPARPEYARASAGQSARHGRGLRPESGRRTARALRVPERAGRDGA